MTFLKILATKAKQYAKIKLNPRHEMTDEQTLARYGEADRQHFSKTDAAITVSIPRIAPGCSTEKSMHA